MSLTIEVPGNSDEVGHFLVQFSNGRLLPAPAKQQQPRFTLYHKSNDKTKRRKIVVAETDQLTYVGTNYDTDSITSGANMCRYCVGAVDRENGTLTLHKAELFTLKPYIPGKTDTDISEISPSKLDRAEVAQKMVSSFGSERQKRAYAAAKKNRVEASTLETALATAVTHAQTEVDRTAVLDSQSMQSSGLMPPHNPKAESPQDVYDLTDIISLEELKILKKTAKTITKATTEDIRQWREDKSHPEYVLHHISLLPSMEPHRTLKAALLLYASFLIKMYNLHPKALEKHGLSSLELPALVKDQLLTKFAERQGEGSHVLTPRMKDKVLSHLFVLALIIDDFSVDCTALQKDLRLTTAKITDHYRALGCTVEKSTVKRKLEADTPLPPSCTASLRIPLNFPRVKKAKRRQES